VTANSPVGTELTFLETTGCPPQAEYKDDPYLDEYKQAIADYRKQVDEDPDRP
jgi:hypothetical protein